MRENDKILTQILNHSNVDLKTLLTTYSDLIAPRSNAEVMLSTVLMLLNRKLTTLDELFSSYDKTHRKQLFKKLSSNDLYLNLAAFCKQYRINLADFIKLDDSLNSMISNHFASISRINYRNPFSLEQLTIFLTILKQSLADNDIAPCLKKILAQLNPSNKPLNATELLLLGDIVKPEKNINASISSTNLFAPGATKTNENHAPPKSDPDKPKQI